MRKPDVAKRPEAAEAGPRYRGPRHVWRGFTPIDNWRGNPSMFERVFTPMRRLTNLPYSDTGLRDVDIELRIIHNVAMAARKARRDGKSGSDAFARFSPTIVGAALGLSRQVVRADFYALLAAGFHEKRIEGNRVLFRPREIDHDLAEAFARYIERHEELPTPEWWSGNGVTDSRDTAPDSRDSGKDVTAGGNDVTGPRSSGYRTNDETPSQTRGFAPEELKEEREELQSRVTPPPPVASPSGSGAGGTEGRPARRWPDGPLCRLCGGALDAEALESGDPAIRGYCPTCRNF